MTLALIISAAPSETVHQHAVRYAQAAKASQQAIAMIYFVDQAASIALPEHQHVATLWREVADQHTIVLSLCSTAFENLVQSESPPPHFELIGHATWVAVTQAAGRIASFPSQYHG
jgi:sulfur relay (sulfurtransferase) complex TusBCD TusD component (DsrE family)